MALVIVAVKFIFIFPLLYMTLTFPGFFILGFLSFVPNVTSFDLFLGLASLISFIIYFLIGKLIGYIFGK